MKYKNNGGRRQGGQRKRWEDNIREWTGLEFGRSQRVVENREKWLRNHLRCPDDPRGLGIDDDDDDDDNRETSVFYKFEIKSENTSRVSPQHLYK